MTGFAAIELGGTRAAVTVGTGPDDHAEPVAIPTTGPIETIAAIGDALQTLRRQGRVFSHIGVASFGPLGVDPDRADWGLIGPTPKPGWSGAAIAGPLAERFSVPVIIDTDVNAAALGEARWGAARGCSQVVYATVGTGVGIGVVIKGRSVHGVLHPEAGHVRPRRLAGDAYEGHCPWHGDCLEGLICGPALAQRLGSPADTLEDANPVFDLAGAYLGEVLASIALVVSPEKIVVGGGVGRRASVLAGARIAFERAIAGYVSTTAVDGSPLIVAPKLASHSGLFGAMILAMSQEDGLQSFA